ncbi:ImmA/IrrE family metallo-endopeptidase [Viridibacillus arvi]|uniref:ImmA/IrrE family metallo-endopeptidase n=1 Tax=Viridibacillus arvi TaxID=263475 RepID=UPI003D2868B8
MVAFNQMDDYVDNLYKDIGIICIEDLRMEIIAERLGIKLAFRDIKSQSIIYENQKYIFIDQRLTKEKQWEQFNHELCHSLWHCGNQMSMINTSSHMFMAYQEVKAETFAMYACVPTSLLNNCDFSTMEYKEALYFIQSTFHVGDFFAKKRLDQFVESKRSIVEAM